MSLGGKHSESRGQSGTSESEETRRFNSALFATLDALEVAKIDFALIGGVAAYAHGRPRSTQDIDIFLRPEDADNALQVLSAAGFKTDRRDPNWLFKAFKEDVLIDIIFRSEAHIYFDDEMNKHTVVQQYRSRPIRLVSPEDFIIIKCAAHTEEGHHHWHDALAVLSQAKIDWNYLIHRARKAPRRLLALLIYAQSTDIWIPDNHIQKLYHSVFGENRPKPELEIQAGGPPPNLRFKEKESDTYLAAKIREVLAESSTTGTLDVEVLAQGEKIVVRGQTQTDDQSKAIIELIRQTAPGFLVEDQLQVANWQPPTSVEALK